jgi:hypothetical protein
MKPSYYSINVNTCTTCIEETDFSDKNLLKLWLSKKIPLSENITAKNFEDVCIAIYSMSLAAGISKRNGKVGSAGGSAEDIRIALAIAMDLEIKIDYYSENARQYKNGLSSKLRIAFLNNDIDSLIYIFSGAERNATTSIIKHEECEIGDYGTIPDTLETIMLEEEIEAKGLIEIEDNAAVWIDVILEDTSASFKKFGGNKIKEKLSSKPAKRRNKQINSAQATLF